jgi:hypothetical protein
MSLRPLLAFAAGFLVSSAAYFLTSKSKKTLEKHKVVRILKDLALESSGGLITLANFCRELRKQAGTDIPDQEIVDVVSKHSLLLDRIHNSQQQVYRRHNVTEEQLKTSCEQDYHDDL